MNDWTFSDLEKYDNEICEIAKEKDLDWFPIIYEVCDYYEMMGHMSYHGMPSHYRHWSYGKSFERTHQMYNLGVEGLPYELIINANPSIAYLMRENPLYLQTLIHPISSIIKQELLLIPFFGWALAFMRPIPINRKNKFQSLRKVIDEANKRLNDGSSVLIFPEGTRIKPENGIAEFSNSCGLLSVKNNIPILPICHNSGKFWENKKFIKKSGLINVRIGPLFKGDDPKVLTNEVKAWMEKEYQKI